MTNREQVDLIYDAVKKINQAYEYWCAKNGVTLYEMQLYYIIKESGKESMTQKSLSEKLDAPKTSVNSIIKKQIEKGFVKMETNPLDRREKMLSLTQKGKDWAEKLVLPLFEFEEKAVSSLKERNLQVATKCQNEFADSLLAQIKKMTDGDL